VGRGVFDTQVRLGLDDAPGENFARVEPADQKPAEERAGEGLGIGCEVSTLPAAAGYGRAESHQENTEGTEDARRAQRKHSYFKAFLWALCEFSVTLCSPDYA
jgi:hypothetical protein